MRTESHKNLDLTLYIYIYTYIFIYLFIYITTVATSCDLDAPRCTTEVLQVRFDGSRGDVFVGHRPPHTPVTPC